MTKYQFTAEFYPDKRSDKVIYRTLLWGVEDGDAFIREHGFTEAPDFDPDNPEYIKEMSAIDVAVLFPLMNNHELADILLAGRLCKNAVVHAQQVDSDNDIRLAFGVEDCHRARFNGNQRNSRVVISFMYNEPEVDLPLRCFKDKMGVVTLFEVMDKLQKDFHNTSLQDIQRQFECGIERAIDIVGHAFKGDLDLDGYPQLLHMTAVAEAGKNDDEILVGMLHDLVEDTWWDFDDLLNEGFPVRVVDSLRLLTHDKNMPYMDYIKNICESGDKVALAVKINDLNHNLKRGRAGGHWQFVEKHEKALAYIQEFMNNNREDEHR